MKLAPLALGAILIAFAHQASADQNDARSVHLYLPGADVVFPLPDGYCQPQGAYAGYANGTAAVDATNFTDVSYDDCAEMQGGQDIQRYGMVKTPRDMMFKEAPLALFDELKKASQSGALKKMLDDPAAIAEARKSIDATTSSQIKVSGMELQPVDFDGHAVYLAGTLKGETSAGKETSAIAVAMMIVKGRVFLCYFYAPYTGLSDIKNLVSAAKAEASRFAQANL
jgi:hypothetical protein